MKTNAIITGAGRNAGIGAEVCRTLARKGINIYFTSFDQYDASIGGFDASDYNKTLQECLSLGIKASFRSFDLSMLENICSLFDEAIDTLGSIDILINCLCYHTFDSINIIDDSLLNANMSINANSVFHLCQEFYRRHEGANGRIVNLSSTQNLEPLTSEISYAISKAVVPAIVYTLAPIMASKGITINAVNPGATEVGDPSDKNIRFYRDCNQFGRLGNTKDAANIICFLASEQGIWITGQTINSEGGIYRGLTKFDPIKDAD